MRRQDVVPRCCVSCRGPARALLAILLGLVLVTPVAQAASLRDIWDDGLVDLISGYLEHHPRDHTIPGQSLTRLTRTDVLQLYHSIFTDQKDRRTPASLGDSIASKTKRPVNGLLGIDNFDFTASTLDRARSRSRLPVQTEWQLARQMSKQQVSTVPASGGGQTAMSMNLSLGDMRRMLDMLKAGR